MRRISRFAWVAAFTLLVASTAWAQNPRTEGDRAGAQGLYQAEVPVNSQGDAERNGAFARALGVVLGKISGDRSAAGRPGVGAELRNAKSYVESYDYRQDQGTSPSGAPTFRSTLVVRFTPSEVDSLMGALGLPVWPQPRPKPVVWLAIDDGSGPRLLSLQQNNAARPLLNRAIERGYKLGLPAGNAAEQAVVGAIWRQDTAAVARASSRYSPPMQLLGKMYRDKAGWVADWVFVDKGKTLSKWTSKNADARTTMAAGADGAAEALMRRYGKAGSAGPAGSYRVVFTGIESADDYLRLSSTLQGMSVVRKITPVRASGSTLEVELELLSGLSGFRRMLGSDSPLQGGEGEPPVYHLR
ncbi:MAG: DUF2066 domain-containing protein [Lysobacteraceae bacterium]|nr:MAG: DUF2066 domain-containing protein [Xanthomonadaceae bacterium]